MNKIIINFYSKIIFFALEKTNEDVTNYFYFAEELIIYYFFKHK